MMHEYGVKQHLQLHIEHGDTVLGTLPSLIARGLINRVVRSPTVIGNLGGW